MSKTAPDFSQISFLCNEKRVTTTGTTPPGDKTNLWKIFLAVINHECLQVYQDHLSEIISENLGILVHEMDERLQAVLREALVYYITTWPGWQRSEEYYKGELLLMDWFGSFRKYLIDKINILIRDVPNYTCQKKDVGIQANVIHKSVAPFTLSISAPPCVLNNIVFEESEGDVFIKQLKGKPWCNLILKEFMNWPYVSVNVKLPDISFTRTNAHVFERYMTYHNDFVVFPESNHIKHIKKLSVHEHKLVVYSYNYILAYMQCFYKTVKTIPGINLNRLQELKAIFGEFLLDIKEANVNNYTMCTNTSVGYNIGKCKYERRNTFGENSIVHNTIDFNEILTPQVDFTLNYFTAIQNVNNRGGVGFKIITELPNDQRCMENMKYVINNNVAITYSCTLCSQSFSGLTGFDDYHSLTKHFAEIHKGQPAVKCCKCKKELEVKELASLRWTHTCV